MSLCRAGFFQHCCWPSYVVRGCLDGSDIHKQIIGDFPFHHRRDGVAGCPSYVVGQHGIPRLIGTAAVTHRMGKWQGRWLRGVASGSIPPFPAWWKGRDGEPSLSVHWSRASPPLAAIRAKGQLRPAEGSCAHILLSDSFSHLGSKSLSLWSVLPPTPGGHMTVTTLRIVYPSLIVLMRQNLLEYPYFCLMSPTLCIIAAFRDITASFQIKRAFLLIFFDWNCLINKQALICTDDHTATQLHQIAHPEMVHHIMLINEWQLLPGVVYINAARLWKGDNCGAKCCRGWQDPFLDLSRSAVMRGLCRSLYTQKQMSVLHQHVCTHVGTWVHTHRQNQPHST